MAEIFAMKKLETPAEAHAKNENAFVLAPAPRELSGPTRRKYPRREFTKKLGVLVAGHYCIAEGVEIGEGGMAFESDIDILKGAVMALTVHIPGSLFIAMTAECLQSKKVEGNRFRTSCVFKNIQFESKRMIRTFVSARV